MAEGFARNHDLSWLTVSSFGMVPLGYVPQPIIDVMAEKGIDLQDYESTGSEAVDWEKVSLLVDMVGIAGPLIPYSGPAITWEIDDPFQGPVAEHRRVRDLISAHVSTLIERLQREHS